MKWLKNSLRFLLVTAGIVALTSLGIDATQYLDGSQSALGILARKATTSECPDGMTLISTSEKSFCIDTYEVSVSDSCLLKVPTSDLDSKQNIDQAECQALSAPEQTPWTFVTYLQAKEICAKRGGRLPNHIEWYEAAIGTPDNGSCNTSGQMLKSGTAVDCRSARGVYDAIGNAWEWIDAAVVDGVYDNRTLPAEGYVPEVDHSGVAINTAETPNPLYNNDYFWLNPDGVMSTMRGGFYGSGEDGGLYSIYNRVPPSFSSAAISFRCVIDR